MYHPRICDAAEARGSSKSKDKEDKVAAEKIKLMRLWEYSVRFGDQNILGIF